MFIVLVVAGSRRSLFIILLFVLYSRFLGRTLAGAATVLHSVNLLRKLRIPARHRRVVEF